MENQESSADSKPLGGLALFAFFLGLSTVAVAQPALDLLGRNPELLGASDASTSGVWMLVLIWIFLAPVLSAGAVLIARLVVPRAAGLVFHLIAGGFVFLIGLAILRLTGPSSDALVYSIAMVFAIFVTFALYRLPVLTQIPMFVASLAIFVLFQFATSPSAAVLAEQEVETLSAFEIGAPADVYFVVFDELPLWALLNTDGTINADLYPGFGRLAERTTWYPNATAVASRTTQSVPAMVTSREPVPGDASVFSPTVTDNLFTVLGSELDLRVYESSTSLCPTELCEVEFETDVASNGTAGLGADLSVAYLHRVLPERTRDRFLPPIDTSWGNFAQSRDASLPAADSSERSFEKTSKALQELVLGPVRQRTLFNEIMDPPNPSEEATLYFYHGLVPHRPYRTTPDGRVYPNTTLALAGAETIREVDDDAIEMQQRLMMQLGFVDLMIRDLIDTMDSSGKWDESMLVVASDHGVSLDPGESMREPTQEESSLQDIFRIPLFVKVPGQSEGEVNRCPANGLDVLPTIVEAMQISEVVSAPGLQMAGEPLSDCEGSDDERRFINEKNTSTNRLPDEGLLDRVQHYAARVDPLGGDLAYARIGRSANLVGTEARSDGNKGSEIDSWLLNEVDALALVESGAPAGSIVPAQFTGEVTLNARLPVGTEAVFAIDGTFAGVLLDLAHGAGPGVQSYSGIVAAELLERPDAIVELYLHYPDGSIAEVGPPINR